MRFGSCPWPHCHHGYMLAISRSIYKCRPEAMDICIVTYPVRIWDCRRYIVFHYIHIYYFRRSLVGLSWIRYIHRMNQIGRHNLICTVNRRFVNIIRDTWKSNGITQVVYRGRYLHHHAVGSFADVREIRVPRSHLKHLAADRLAVYTAGSWRNR